MPLNFPSNPTNGQVYDRFFWDASAGIWRTSGPIGPTGPTGPSVTGPTGPTGPTGLNTSFSSPQAGDSLVYNGTNWVNSLRSNNAIINGNFDIYQRGTSFSITSSGTWVADRWQNGFDGTGSTRNSSRQSFAVNELNVPGYGEPQFYLRYQQTVAGSGGTFNNIGQYIEDVRTFANQTVTISFWAKAAAATTRTITYGQVFGAGGSSASYFNGGTFNLTTSWQRFSATTQTPSLAGKTIGSNSYFGVFFDFPINSTFTIDLWGVQLEAGPVASPFRPAGGGSRAAELVLCQRYYWRNSDSSASFLNHLQGSSNTATVGECRTVLPTSMRVAPYSVEWGNLEVMDSSFAAVPVTGITLQPLQTSTSVVMISYNNSGSLTTNRPVTIRNSNNSAGFFAVTAEI